MALVTSLKDWGIAVSINTATAADNVVSPKGTSVRVGAIVCGGVATTDRITVKDGSGDMIWQGAALVGQSDSIVFTDGQRLDGITVGFAGATTGWCNLIYATK